MDFNTPEVVKDPATFQRAAAKIGYTFNWFYADAEHIAYFNSGANPERAPGVDHDFPVAGEVRVAGLEPGHLAVARSRRSTQHPQAVDQDYFVNWNNKQAKAYRSADANAYSSTYRSVLLEDRVKAGIAGAKMTLPQLIDAMELGGTTDLRALGGPAAGAAGARQAVATRR